MLTVLARSRPDVLPSPFDPSPGAESHVTQSSVPARDSAMGEPDYDWATFINAYSVGRWDPLTPPLQPRSPTRTTDSHDRLLSQQRSQTETRLQVTVEKTVHHDVSDELAARRGQRSSRSEPGATPDSLDELSKTPPGGYVSLPSATITHAV